ncbi:MAG: hypothetical protein AAF466_10425 [Bacteroidota bacterium]
MTTTNKPNTWYWIIAVIALLWNAMGVSRYLMQAYDAESFRAEFNAEQLALIDGTPAWASAIFALAVFTGLIGSLMLLLRRRLAVPLLGISLLCVLIQMIYAWLGTDTLEHFDTVNAVVMPIIVIVIAIFLFYYSKGAKQKNWLR